MYFCLSGSLSKEKNRARLENSLRLAGNLSSLEVTLNVPAYRMDVQVCIKFGVVGHIFIH